MIKCKKIQCRVENNFCKTICGYHLDNGETVNVGSMWCKEDCKYFYAVNEKEKFILCKAGYEI